VGIPVQRDELRRPQGLKPGHLGILGDAAKAASFQIRARDSMGLPPCKCLKAQAIFSHARAEDEKLRKELTLEVLALKVPFGSLLSVSESSPVAGAIQGINPCNTLDAGRARELQKCAQPATQLLSVHCLYQGIVKSARGYLFFRAEVYRNGTLRGSSIVRFHVEFAP
jgi:hypothetical protein